MRTHFAYVGPGSERRSLALFLYRDDMGDDLEECQRVSQPGDYPHASIVGLHDARVRQSLRNEICLPLVEGDAEVIAEVAAEEQRLAQQRAPKAASCLIINSFINDSSLT